MTLNFSTELMALTKPLKCLSRYLSRWISACHHGTECVHSMAFGLKGEEDFYTKASSDRVVGHGERPVLGGDRTRYTIDDKRALSRQSDMTVGLSLEFTGPISSFPPRTGYWSAMYCTCTAISNFNYSYMDTVDMELSLYILYYYIYV